MPATAASALLHTRHPLSESTREAMVELLNHHLAVLEPVIRNMNRVVSPGRPGEIRRCP